MLASLALAAMLATASGASAEAGGPGAGGGAVYVEKPRIGKVSCIRGCASRKRARPGSTLKISGRGLSGVKGVVFHGTVGRADDVRSAARSGSARRVQVRVPMGAVSGPVSVQVSGTLGSARTKPLAILPPAPPNPNPRLTPVPGPRDRGAPRLETGTSRTRAFYGSLRTVVFSFRISEAAPANVQVELVRVGDGSVAQAWSPPTAAPGSVQSVVWNGNFGRVPAQAGRYAFRLTVAGTSGARARSAQSGDVGRDAFDLFDHVFPVRGRHDFGGPGARFGTGRAGHSHQGHDVFARCGTRMVAARGGTVKFKGFHRAAGNYVVIDGAGNSVDYAYMHLAEPTPFTTGDRVYTGQRIGSVGDTGNARGCHLHYEMWGPPGWYDGGRPFDPLPALMAWDGWS